MKIKFEDLGKLESQPVPLKEKPMRNGDHCVIRYITLRNDVLNISVTKEEAESIEFSKDFRYMQLPDFLVWKKGSKGPYLAHVDNSVETSTTSTTIDW